MNKMQKYEITLCKKIYTKQTIHALCKETAIKAMQETIDQDNVCEFQTEEEDWEIEDISEV